ncbi:MAG TPA: hypothetical protein VMB71_05780 [Acetobacteraceae bacterium]|nr:hypothetical protein [Acetobacteraceae bacterium]
MARVRLRVVLPAIAVGLIAIMSANAAYLVWRTPYRAFVEDWDSNVARTQPAIWPAIQADPVLHRLMIEKTAAAFQRAGWTGAKAVFFRIVASRIQANAGDAATLACDAAWRNVYRALLPDPASCAIVARGSDDVSSKLAGAEIAHAHAVCNRAIEDGAVRRLSPDPPGQMTDQEYYDTYTAAMNGPRPLTPAEQTSLRDIAPADAAALCTGQIAHGDNVAALPAAQAARYLRHEYASEDQGGFDYAGPAPAEFAGDPPSDYRCAAAGTRFTLSMEASRDGEPIVWESLGRTGWDCRLRSSLSGVRGLWGSDAEPPWALTDGNDSTIRLLWPLKVGKTVTCACHPGFLTAFRITGYDRYWLPWASPYAYAIEEKISTLAGVPQYASTRYWAPELGFVIGQHTIVWHGAWPNAAPDWQLVAMSAPGST